MADFPIVAGGRCRGVRFLDPILRAPREIFAKAEDLKLQKVVARMAAEQKGPIQVFEKLGFNAEALLADYVIDRKNRTHDLIAMSYDLTGFNEE